MTFDRYVFSFFENLFKQPFQVNNWIDSRSLYPYFFLGNFYVEWLIQHENCQEVSKDADSFSQSNHLDVCLKEDEFIISAFAGSNVTMTYAEIGASLQQ